MKLVIASRNVHKIREIRCILKGVKNLDLLSLLDFPKYMPPEETGSSFEENATLKATHAASALGLWALADDSGLIVPALKGAPGLHSARYAGAQASDKDNRKKLLQEMKTLHGHERQAYFECTLALASPQGLHRCFRGVCEGMITTEERGSKGFGYDSIFLKHDYGKTLGELSEEIKNRISHRKKALDKLMLALEALQTMTASAPAS